MTRRVLFVRIVCVSCLCFLVSMKPTAQSVTETDKLLAQIQALRGENWQLKLSAAQCQAKLADTTLAKEAAELQVSQATFRADIRKKLGAKTDDEVDWVTLTLKKKTQ